MLVCCVGIMSWGRTSINLEVEGVQVQIEKGEFNSSKIFFPPWLLWVLSLLVFPTVVIFCLTWKYFYLLYTEVFANDPGDLGSIPIIPKTQKMVRDSSLLNTQHYKVWIKGKVEQSRERSSALPYISV